MRSSSCPESSRRPHPSAQASAERKQITQYIQHSSSLATPTWLAYAARVSSAARTVPRSRALTLLAWLLCALLGPGPALPALHFALVAHRVCPEHGELEHVDPATRQTEGTRVASATSNSVDLSPALVPGSDGSDGHGHEPCDGAAAGASGPVLPAAHAALAAPQAPSAAAPRGTERAHHRIALLCYAPKLPPPASA